MRIRLKLPRRSRLLRHNRSPKSPFRAGIPDRDTLVVYSDRRRLSQRTERQLRKDYRTSGYPITPRPFLVTPDGIAPAPP